MPDALLLRFSQEELVYLLRALSIGSFPGLDIHPLGNLNADQQALALAIADRTLRAKGAVGWDGQENRHVDPIVAGMLRDCAQPTYSVLINLVQTGRLNARYLYAFTRHAAIEHYLPEPGIHQFLLIPSPADTLSHIIKLLALDNTVQPSDLTGEISHTERLSVERWEAVRVNASTNLNKTVMVLSADLEDETARALASALATPKQVGHLALWHGAPDEAKNVEPDATLTLVQGDTDTGLFLLWKGQQKASHIEVMQETALQAERYIEKLLQPALEVLERKDDYPATI